MVSRLRDEIQERLNARLTRVLDAAEIGIPGRDQFQAFRKFALREFGNQGFLPELDALLQQHGQARNGQAEAAGKEVPR
ncbi:hypothetical protein [Rhodocyclus tenuis]|uniref:hypothetical protein n=1 Tax=Rhodocyclus tenuis TaxID=1066 RepID=UPI001904F509|nr:hypothetical protein [Rhodocyclus tenuis]MBK1679881.1 hypothetical protein [Rhodocyclus tenuis]